MREYVTVGEIAKCVRGIVEGDKEARVYGLALPFDSQEDDLTFIGKGFSAHKLEEIQANVMITPLRMATPKGKTYIKTLYEMGAILDQLTQLFIDKGIYNKVLEQESVIAQDAKVASTSVIGKNCLVGQGTIIEDFVRIGDNVTIGDYCVIKSGVSIESETYIGNQVIIKSGARIGGESFEYGSRQGEWIKIPNIGKVIIHDNVEIGSNTTIDRGTIGNTIIGQGTKIDNLVEIAHEVVIGERCKIVAHTALAGWSSVGNHTVIYGQCGVSNHVHIGNGVTVLAKSGVTKNIDDGMVVSGFPACEHGEEMRRLAYLRRQMKK